MIPAFRILTDSACDLSAADAQALGVGVLPMAVSFSGTAGSTYPPCGDEDYNRRFFARLASGALATTAALSPEQVRAAAEPLLAQGCGVLFLSFSSALSSSFASAWMAARSLRTAYHAPMRVFDTRTGSFGQQMLVRRAVELRDSGASLAETLDALKALRGQVCAWFTLFDLMHVRRGGRISTTTAIVGSLLHVKPLFHVDDAGALAFAGKVRGRVASIRALADRVKESVLPGKSPEIWVGHGDCANDAAILAGILQQELHARVQVHTIGPVTGAHGGPGTLAVFYLGKAR